MNETDETTLWESLPEFVRLLIVIVAIFAGIGMAKALLKDVQDGKVHLPSIPRHSNPANSPRGGNPQPDSTTDQLFDSPPVRAPVRAPAPRIDRSGPNFDDLPIVNPDDGGGR
jgi:hypothetical protein